MDKQFEQVTVLTRANIYFDGKVVSHTVQFADGSKKTLGLIYPGEFRFNTDAPELMQIIDGACRARLAGKESWTNHATGGSFNVPGKSHFDIAVDSGIAQYICSFEKS